MKTDMKLWATVICLIIANWITAERFENLYKEVQTLNERMAAVERTDKWFNTVYTNTIAVTCDYMLHQEAKQWASKISEQIMEAIETGYPTNTLSESFGVGENEVEK